MVMNNLYINIFYAFVTLMLIGGSFWFKPRTKSWIAFNFLILVFAIGELFSHSYLFAASALFVFIINGYKFHQNVLKNKSLEVIFVNEHDDQLLQHFLKHYRKDITKYFPKFDFEIEPEFLIAFIMSEAETIGLVIAEIKNAETLRICLDYIIPKYRSSELANTFYHCELRCVHFLGYRHFYIEPQSKAHNSYLERIGFKLIEGKYVIQ